MKMLKPLRWPEGWNRMEVRRRGVLYSGAAQKVEDELHDIGATKVTLTANIDLTDKETPCDDPGAAAYFSINDRPYVIASDRFHMVSANFDDIQHTLSDLNDLIVGGEAIQDRALQGFTELPPEKAGITWPLHWMRIMGSLPDWNRMMPETQRRWIDQRYAELMLQPMSEQAFRDLRQARVEAFADVGAFVMGDKE